MRAHPAFWQGGLSVIAGLIDPGDRAALVEEGRPPVVELIFHASHDDVLRRRVIGLSQHMLKRFFFFLKTRITEYNKIKIAMTTKS